MATATKKKTNERSTTPPGQIAKKIRSDYGLSQPVLSRLLGVSIKTVSLLESGKGKTVDGTVRNLIEVRRLLLALGGIMRVNFVAEWLGQPNESFSDLKPIEVIERGESDRIWQMIYHVGSGEPI